MPVFANYFAGLRETFASLPLDLDAATDFQREVWEVARRVSRGNYSTYGELALHMGKPKSAARAVGHALGQNPIAESSCRVTAFSARTDRCMDSLRGWNGSVNCCNLKVCCCVKRMRTVALQDWRPYVNPCSCSCS